MPDGNESKLRVNKDAVRERSSRKSSSRNRQEPLARSLPITHMVQVEKQLAKKLGSVGPFTSQTHRPIEDT